MFEQIETHSEIADMVKESVHQQGIVATIVGGLGVAVVFILIICVIALLSGWGMTDADVAKRILQESGYSSIAITGYRWFTCDKNDYFHTGFSAVGPSGRRVTGTVCKGMVFKSSTIRLD
jgi:hypothetical protein